MRWSRVQIPLLSGAASFAFLACAPEACGCSPLSPEVTGMVFGTVFTPDSTPVAGAVVVLTGGLGSCEPDDDVHVHDGHTDAVGAYEAYFEAYDLDDRSVCIVGRATPPAGSGFGPSATIQLGYDDEDHNQHIVEEHDFYLTPAAP